MLIHFSGGKMLEQILLMLFPEQPWLHVAIAPSRKLIVWQVHFRQSIITLNSNIISSAHGIKHGHVHVLDIKGEAVGISASLVLDAAHVLLLANANRVPK